MRRFRMQEIESVVKTEIDVNDLSNGLYFIRVVQAGSVTQLQFVKI